MVVIPIVFLAFSVEEIFIWVGFKDRRSMSAHRGKEGIVTRHWGLQFGEKERTRVACMSSHPL